MKKHLFLTGLSGIGKTTIIRQSLGKAAGYAGGFITERVADGDGRTEGFDLIPLRRRLDTTALTGSVS